MSCCGLDTHERVTFRGDASITIDTFDLSPVKEAALHRIGFTDNTAQKLYIVKSVLFYIMSDGPASVAPPRSTKVPGMHSQRGHLVRQYTHFVRESSQVYRAIRFNWGGPDGKVMDDRA